MTSWLARDSWMVRPAGTYIPPPACRGRQALRVEDGPAVLREVVELPLELAGQGADPRRRGVLFVSTTLSVCHEITNMKMTMRVGTTVQTISAMLLPWVCGGKRDVVRLASIADDGPHDQPFDEEEDRGRDDEDDRVQVAHLGALLRHRLGRVETGHERLAVLDDVHAEDERRRSRRGSEARRR